VLASSPNLANLTRLDLGKTALGADSVRALAASPYLKNLTYLYLDGNDLGDSVFLRVCVEQPPRRRRQGGPARALGRRGALTGCESIPAGDEGAVFPRLPAADGPGTLKPLSRSDTRNLLMARQPASHPDLPKARPEVAAFLAAAKDEPEDDATRLVLCDWLEENGDANDAARAAFIRLKCEFASAVRGDPRVADLLDRESLLHGISTIRFSLMVACNRLAAKDARLKDLRQRAADLQKQHEARWLGPLRDRAYSRVFDRGLLTLHIHGRKFACRLMAAVAASDLAPWVESLHLRLLPREALARTSRCPFLAHLRTLDLSHTYRLGAEGLATLASSPHLTRLVRLNASSTGLSEGGGEALAAASGLAHLEELALGSNQLGPRGAVALAGAPHLGTLAALNLSSNQVGPEGVRALASSPHLSRLAALNLSNNSLGTEGAAALATASGLPGLTMLELGRNNLGPGGLAALLTWPGLERITVLGLSANGLGDTGAAALASSPRLASATYLDLSGNQIGPEGTKALVDSPYLAGLKRLILGNNPIGVEGARALADSPHLAGLTSLQVWPRDVTAEGDKLLRERFGESLRR
jgi:uncharacterized protein (TIGR02996 family)